MAEYDQEERLSAQHDFLHRSIMAAVIILQPP